MTVLQTITLCVLACAVLLQAISLHFVSKTIDVQSKLINILAERVRENELKDKKEDKKE